MSDSPVLSIIIVSWNVRALLLKCLDAVYGDPSAPPLEVLVVDNASSDGTVTAVLAHYPQTVVIANAQNVGFPRANNQALPFTNGRYVLYLNPDTEVRPGTLVACTAELDRDHTIGAVGSRLEFANGDVQFDGARRAYRLRHLLLEVFYLHTLFPRHPFFGHQVIGEWDHCDNRDVE